MVDGGPREWGQYKEGPRGTCWAGKEARPLARRGWPHDAGSALNQKAQVTRHHSVLGCPGVVVGAEQLDSMGEA